MTAPLITAEHVHGKSGLDGIDLPTPSVALQSQHGVDFIIDTLRREPAGTGTLVPIGPLTNIAQAFRRAPDIIGRVQEIVLMGGAYFEVGNITPAAEFNIFVDPEAAAEVFAAGAPLVVMPLDATHEAVTSPAGMSTLDERTADLQRLQAEYLNYKRRVDRDRELVRENATYAVSKNTLTTIAARESGFATANITQRGVLFFPPTAQQVLHARAHPAFEVCDLRGL